MKNRFAVALGAVALGAVLLAAGVLYAGAPVSEHMAEIKEASSTNALTGAPDFLPALSGLNGTDSTTWNRLVPTPGRCFPTHRDPMVEVSVRHSAPGATACIQIGRRDAAGKFIGIADVQTSTALNGSTLTVYDGVGYFAASPLYFAVNGWTTYELKVLDCSGSTTCDLLPVTVGATGAAAE